MGPRFKITRAKVPARRPWILKDAARPAFRGAYASHALAVHAMGNRLRSEHGARPLPYITTEEIRAAMRGRIVAVESDEHGAISPHFSRDFDDDGTRA